MPGIRSKIRTSIGDGLELDPKERAFATFLAEGKSPKQAHVLSGYLADRNANRVAQRPEVQAYARKIYQKNAKMMDMSRKRVMEGILEAIEQAKIMSEPMTQIAGWRELAKMCGFYAPEVKKIDINVTSQRVLSQLETLSDADLLEMIEKDAETIEGEAQKLLDLDGHPDLSEGADSGAAPEELPRSWGGGDRGEEETRASE